MAVSSEATNNASCTVIQTSPPGGGTVVHMYSRQDEVLVVLEGEYADYDGGSWHRLNPAQPRYLVRFDDLSRMSGITVPPPEAAPPRPF